MAAILFSGFAPQESSAAIVANTQRARILKKTVANTSGITKDYGVAFFGESNLKYYTPKNVTLGGAGKPFFHMAGEDAVLVRNAGDAARYTGMAPSAQAAYLNGGDVYGISFPRGDLSVTIPTAADAGGWPHFLEGGRTAVMLEGNNAGYLVNPVREFIVPGGGPMPTGSVLFRLGTNGMWIPLRKY